MVAGGAPSLDGSGDHGGGYTQRNAGIAQLVERNLAKVEVAGSNPVSRSNFKARSQFPGSKSMATPAVSRSNFKARSQFPGSKSMATPAVSRSNFKTRTFCFSLRLIQLD